MKNYITNIELINEHIIITYNNKYIKKVIYNKNNRDEIIANLELNKNNLKTERKHINKFKNYLYLLSFFKISMTILVYLITNNLITRTLITIWCLEICAFCSILIKELQKDKLSIDTLLKVLFTKELPNEDEYLSKRKITDIEKYKSIKYRNNFLENNFHDAIDDSKKILAFKKK